MKIIKYKDTSYMLIYIHTFLIPLYPYPASKLPSQCMWSYNLPSV